MAEIPVYLPLALYWRPVGASKAQPIAHAYCVLEISKADSERLLRAKVGEASIMASEFPTSLRIQARTDARGVLMTIPKHGAQALDPLVLANLSPLLCPLGMSANLWWAPDLTLFEQALHRERSAREQGESRWQGAIELTFDEDVDLPKAVEAVLVELDDGPTLRKLLLKSREQSFPSELLRLTDDERTWCVELRDHALELALDAAASLLGLDELLTQHHFAAHQLLLGHVLDILERRGREGDPFTSVIPKHAHLGGRDYRALKDDFRNRTRRTAAEVSDAGDVLLRALSRALDELSLHPYPEGSFEERGAGAVSREWAVKRLIDAASVRLQDEILERLSNQSEPGLEERLLKLVRGEAEPLEGNRAEQFWAQVAAIGQWLGDQKSLIQDSAKTAAAVSDPGLVVPLTAWLDNVLIAAAQTEKLGTQKLVTAVTRGMRAAQVWMGAEPDFEFELDPKVLTVESGSRDWNVRISVADSARWTSHFERAGKLLSALNGFALAQSMVQPDGTNPSLVKTLVDAHGFVEGLDEAYRLLSKAAETHLGVSLKMLARYVEPAGIYLAAEDAWIQFKAGHGLATLLSTSSLFVTILGVATKLAKTAPHPATKAAILLTGLAFAVASALVWDEEQKFLEQYRPGCESGGAYSEAENAVRTVERELDRCQEFTRQVAGRVGKLGL